MPDTDLIDWEMLEGEHQGKESLRLWLRLLRRTMTIEKVIRSRLVEDYETTLPRFDVLSALERNREGLTMGALSRALLVSNGNTTHVVNHLIDAGWVERIVSSDDRRVARVRLTRSGTRAFKKMAKSHETWVDDLFAGLSETEKTELYALLGRLADSMNVLSEKGSK